MKDHLLRTVNRRFFFVILSSWVAVSCTVAVSPETNVPSARLTKDTYTSPDGGYTVALPPLVKPGAKVEERQGGPATHGVFFVDDFGKVYYIVRTDNTEGKLTLEQISAEFQVGEFLGEKQYATSDGDKQLRLARITIRGNPFERKNVLYEAWSIFIRGAHIYQVIAGVTPLPGESETDILDRAKRNLEEILKGLRIKPEKQKAE